MAAIETWPWLIGGPGDGERIARDDHAYLEYPGEVVPFLYRQVKLVIVPDRVAVRCYVCESVDNPTLAAYQAMAKIGLERAIEESSSDGT